MLVREAQTMDQNTRQIHKGGPLWICGQQNVWSNARQQRATYRGYAPSTRIEIKIPGPAGKRTRATGLEGKDSADHGIATSLKVQISFAELIHIWSCLEKLERTGAEWEDGCYYKNKINFLVLTYRYCIYMSHERPRSKRWVTQTVAPIPGGRLLWHGDIKVGPIWQMSQFRRWIYWKMAVPINLSLKLGFVSVRGPRETCFVDTPRKRNNYGIDKTSCYKKWKQGFFFLVFNNSQHGIR